MSLTRNDTVARSNNVLNVGFCPPADRNNVDTFANTLTFKTHSKEDVILPPKKSDKGKKGKTLVYSPPMSEFDMLKTDLAKGEAEEIAASEGPGVLIVTSGQGVLRADGEEFKLSEGYIFFIAPGISAKLETQDGLQTHMAVI